MKKILFVFMLLIFIVNTVSAQDTDVLTTELSFSTIGEMISWDTPAEDIYEMLNEYALDIQLENDETYGKTITASGENDDETFFYVFYFDDETEALWEIECASVVYDSETVPVVFQQLFESYGLEYSEPYEDERFESYVEGFDACIIVAGDSTIAILAGNDETDESYAMVTFVLINREYWESLIL